MSISLFLFHQWESSFPFKKTPTKSILEKRESFIESERQRERESKGKCLRKVKCLPWFSFQAILLLSNCSLFSSLFFSFCPWYCLGELYSRLSFHLFLNILPWSKGRSSYLELSSFSKVELVAQAVEFFSMISHCSLPLLAVIVKIEKDTSNTSNSGEPLIF